jgi:pyruvate kinase
VAARVSESTPPRAAGPAPASAPTATRYDSPPEVPVPTSPRQPTRSKILVTLGPASWEEAQIEALIDAGADCFRINGSHADHAGIRRQVARVRKVALRRDRAVGILLDLQGPKIRIGKVEGQLELRDGSLLTVVMDDTLVCRDGAPRVGTTYPEMAKDVTIGDRVLFADGLLSGVVEGVDHAGPVPEVLIRMEVGGTLTSNKGLNLPGVRMSVPSMTEKDLADVVVGVEVGVDWVALSFVRTAADVMVLRDELTRLGADTPIVAKIEKPDGVDNIDEILDVAEAVMVARGDLGVEVSLEKVPVYQKHIIERASRRGRVVITATQMLDSMERNPRPTRAETTDVANAILDGTDAVMLSGETATGRYPLESVRTMDRIANEVENSVFFHRTPEERLPRLPEPTDSIIRAATLASKNGQRPFVVFTWSGASAIAVSKARLPGRIFALTPDPRVVDRLQLVWGVEAFLVPRVRSTDELIAAGEHVLLSKGLLRRGEEIVVLAGRTPHHGTTNVLKVYALGSEP